VKKLVYRTIQFIKKRKYYLLAFFFIFFVWWWFCLPKELFNSPTATVLLDKDGQLLNAQIAQDGQWRFPYNDSVPYKFKEAIIEFEDHRFYSHLGVSPRGIVRALKQNISSGELVSGASTLTMQVIRMSRNKPRTLYQKIVEMIWATRLEARLTKAEILALYASNAPMGGNVVGLDAGSWRYFQRSPSQLSWAETATLAVLPNAPSLIHIGKNRKALKNKRDRLLTRLYKKGTIDKETLKIAKEESLPDNPKPLPQLAIHLMNKALQEGKKGQRITTNLNVDLQKSVIELLDYHHQKLKTNNIFNGAVLIGEIKTGKIIAYVGNTQIEDKEHCGDVDIINAARSSGSILKPFLYGFMIQEGYLTPKQVIYDVPTTMAGYSPENYNQKYAGIVSADEALSKSLNVPFVRMLRDYGIQKFHSNLTKIGMTTLDKPATHYGLSLILGGCEVTLFDLVSMYAKMSRSVSQTPSYNSLTNATLSCYSTIPELNYEPIISPSAAWVTLQAMEHVVRPNKEKNWEEFSTSDRIAWKTGTSFGFRDAWAVGLNTEYVVGVWVGNADGEGRPGVIGVEAAAPILFDVFDLLPKSDWFIKPVDEFVSISICKKSGMRANKNCPEVHPVFLPVESQNSALCNFHQIIFLDKSEQYRVSSNCYSVSDMVQKTWFTLPPKAAYYYQMRTPDYQEIPGFKKGCEEAEVMKQLSVLYPKNESKIVVTRTETGDQSSIVMEALHRDPEAILFWHLNEKYIGSTNHIHQMDKELSPGNYELKVIDELGNSEKIRFVVVKN
jgi:penicillin-binding protein 1C